MTTATKTKTYDEASIGMLEGLEAVRHRPSMYIGAPDKKGLHHLVWEIVDNSIDEFLNGFGDAITVTLHKSGDAVTVTDNGRCIPVDRKSTRLNSSHRCISYAVFCLKKKKQTIQK